MRRQGTNKVDMYMCKSSEGNRNLLRVNVNMAEDLSLLALKAGFAPDTDVIGYPPDKPCRDKTSGCTNSWM